MERRPSSKEAERQCLYQRAMVTLFRDMIHHGIKCYAIDMIAKSQTEEGHLVDLAKLLDQFETIQIEVESE
jgi:hypothetical protein